MGLKNTLKKIFEKRTDPEAVLKGKKGVAKPGGKERIDLSAMGAARAIRARKARRKKMLQDIEKGSK